MSSSVPVRRADTPSIAPPIAPSCALSFAPSVAGRASACTCFQVRRLARRVTQFYDRSLAGCGLRVTQYALLSRLLPRPLAMQTLACALDMDRTTLTRNLKPLVQARLVAMEPDPADARVRLIRLTTAGRARHDEAMRLWRHAQDDIDRAWGAAEVASLHRLFDGLIETFNDKASEPSQGEAA